MQKLIKIIADAGPLPEWTAIQAAIGIKAMPSTSYTAQGSVSFDGMKPSSSSTRTATGQFPNLFDQKYKGGKRVVMESEAHEHIGTFVLY